MKQRIFIVGVGRSGTSLLQAILGSHSHVEFLPETSFLRRYVFDGLASQSTETLWQAVTNDQRVARLNPDWETLIANGSCDTAIEIYEKLTVTSAEITGDKDPRLVEYIQCLNHRWDNCRIVHLSRDPRDVLSSKKKANWSKNRSLLFYLVAGVAQYKLATQPRSLSKNLIHLQYESLITSPKEVLKPLCSSLGIEFEPEMLNFGRTAQKLTSEQELSWKKETFGPLLTSNQGKWKQSLTNFEAKATEIACSQIMSDGKYKSANVRLTLFERMAAFFIGNTAKIIASVYVMKVNRRNNALISQMKNND